MDPVAPKDIEDAQAVIDKWQAAVDEERARAAGQSSEKRLILDNPNSAIHEKMVTLRAGVGRSC